VKRTIAFDDCLSVTGQTPRKNPDGPSTVSMLRTACGVDLYTRAPATSSINRVLMFSLGVSTSILSATPAQRPAIMFPNTVVLPDVSLGIMLRAVSNVRNRMPDLEALEMQNAPPPVYSLAIPCSRIVDCRIPKGDCAVLPCPRNSCCRVLTYSVGY
jgi:hypothetical protein